MSFSRVPAGLPLPLVHVVMLWMSVFSRLLCLTVKQEYLILLLLFCSRSIDSVLICSTTQLLVLWSRHEIKQAPVGPHFKRFHFSLHFLDKNQNSQPYVSCAGEGRCSDYTQRKAFADCLVFPIGIMFLYRDSGQVQSSVYLLHAVSFRCNHGPYVSKG